MGPCRLSSRLRRIRRVHLHAGLLGRVSAKQIRGTFRAAPFRAPAEEEHGEASFCFVPGLQEPLQFRLLPSAQVTGCDRQSRLRLHKTDPPRASRQAPNAVAEARKKYFVLALLHVYARPTDLEF